MLVSRKFIFIMMFLSIIFISIFIYKKITLSFSNSALTEGFIQSMPFVLKRDDNVYDEFYSEIYDKLFHTDKKTNYIINGIISITSPTYNNSVFLDVGSKTGVIVNALNNKNYNAFGVEKSQDMVKISEKKCSACSDKKNEIIKQGDVLNPLLYEHSTFTHILLLNETIYEFNDKKQIIRILKGWLKRNGFLIIHVVSRQKYTMDTIQEKEFNGVNYKSTYKKSNNTEFVFQEKIIDNITTHTRQNERTMYVEPITNIVQDIKNEGFIVHGIVDLKPITQNEYEYLYIFENIG